MRSIRSTIGLPGDLDTANFFADRTLDSSISVQQALDEPAFLE